MGAMPFSVINTQKYLTKEAQVLLEENDCQIRNVAAHRLSEDEFCTQIRGAHAVIGGDWSTPNIIRAADSLKIIALTGVGFDYVDLDVASERRVWVINTPGATSHAVADLTIGLMLCLLRNIPAMVQDMNNGEWVQFCGRELGSLTVGIVGVGSIGKQVIKRLRGFGTAIIGHDAAPDEQFATQWQVQYVALDELLTQSDIVSLHCPLNEQTRGLIDERRLNLMKKDACLVNTSRSGVVDKDALMDVLRRGEIAAAAIDVHDPRPCAPDDPLVALENVIATPWTAYNTEEAIERMCLTAATDIVTVLNGGVPKYPVNEF